MSGFKGGSDLHPIQDMAYFLALGCSFEIVTSDAGYGLYTQEGIKENERIHFKVLKTPGAENAGLTQEYLIRTVRAIAYSLKVNLKEANVVKSNSDWGLFDAIPAAIIKLRNRKIVWIAVCWHLIDSPFSRKGRQGFSITNIASFLSQRLMLLLIKLFGDLVFAETKVVIEELTVYGITSEKSKIARGAIDSEMVRNTPAMPKTFDACYLGRIHPEKGIFDALKIWRKVCDKMGDKKLLVMGSATPHWVEAFKEAVKTQGLENNVLFVGSVSDAEKYKYLKSCKVFMHTSFEDGLPVTVCEAMACGLPVIAYELPTYQDGWMLLDYVKVPVGDQDRFADELIRLLSDERSFDKHSNNTQKALEYDFKNRAKQMLVEVNKKRLKT
jgi:glycosyltransferase involved in cell wall biosynthesis